MFTAGSLNRVKKQKAPQISRHLDPVPVKNGGEVVDLMKKGEKSIKCVNAGLGPEDARQICEVLRPNEGDCECEELLLGANKMGSDGATVFGEVLKMKTSLHKLDLAANRINANGIDRLAEALRLNMTFLVSLNLSYNSLGDDGVEKLAENLKANQVGSPLEDLNLSMNEIGPKGCSTIGEFLRAKNSSLRNLNLGRNFVKAQGGIEIAEALKENSTLKQLNLAGSLQCPNIESKGAQAIAEALRMPSPLRELQNDDSHEDNFALQHLVLSYNCIEDEAGKALGQEMKSNHTLKYLSLKGNLLTLESGKVFAEMLCTNKTLHTLDISENRLNNAAGLSFARALTVNRGLRGLNLSANPLGGKYATEESKKTRVGKEFAAIVQHNKTLERVILGGCGLEEEEIDAIHHGVETQGVFLKFELE